MLSPRPARLSLCTSTYLVLPGYTNIHGNIFGGKLMEWIDVAGAISAYRHSQSSVVTASIDDIYFLHPIKAGYVVILESKVSFTGLTSMEICCQVFSEHPQSGERLRSNTAYLTFVALDSGGKPTPVPPLLLETQEEQELYNEAKERREYRLSRLHLKKK